jgi:hypothetical protein
MTVESEVSEVRSEERSNKEKSTYTLMWNPYCSTNSTLWADQVPWVPMMIG